MLSRTGSQKVKPIIGSITKSGVVLQAIPEPVPPAETPRYETKVHAGEDIAGS